MKHLLPNSPFATRLSGSAKETELRIRNIFQWKRKRPPVLLFAAFLVLIAACGSLVEFTSVDPGDGEQDIPTQGVPKAEESPAPTPEGNAVDAAALDVVAAMKTVTAEDLKTPGSFGNVSTQELARALNDAVADQINDRVVESEGYIEEQLFPQWAMEAYLTEPAAGDAWSSTLRHLDIACGLTENIVEVNLRENNQSNTAYVEDETLYWLIRRAYDIQEAVDPAAYQRFEAVLVQEMEETFRLFSDNPGNFTGYELTRFMPVGSYKDRWSGGQVVLYDFDFALLTEHPERVGWAGGMALDSKLRVGGVNSAGQLAVKYRGDEVAAVAFMGSDFYYYAGEEDTELAGRAMERIQQAIFRAEHGGFRYAQREGKTAVVTEKVALQYHFSFVYSDPGDLSTYWWVFGWETMGWELDAGDIVLVLGETDGMSRVMIPYGDYPYGYGYVPSDMLSLEREDIERGNHARVESCDAYDMADGSVINSLSGPVEIRERDGEWAGVVQCTGGDHTLYWIRAGELSFDFDMTVWDLPD